MFNRTDHLMRNLCAGLEQEIVARKIEVHRAAERMHRHSVPLKVAQRVIRRAVAAR